MRLMIWSVADAGLVRLAAALAAVMATLAVARSEFRRLVESPRQPDRAMLRTVLGEGSLLGVQQVVAGLMVLLLYIRAIGVGVVTASALTLTLAGVYPLLFCFAWGSTQAVGAAASQAVGRGDARELVRIVWLGLTLAMVPAFALPWGVYAVCGRPTLAWLVEGNPAGPALLAAILHFMSWLTVFFVFDFAINFLSALLRAMKEEVYLLTATATAAGSFGLLHLVLPPADGAWLMGAFIAAQAAWGGLLLIRVVSRWPVRRQSLAWPHCRGGDAWRGTQVRRKCNSAVDRRLPPNAAEPRRLKGTTVRAFHRDLQQLVRADEEFPGP
jgi:Na+-driven multidrug efflux pump